MEEKTNGQREASSIEPKDFNKNSIFQSGNNKAADFSGENQEMEKARAQKTMAAVAEALKEITSSPDSVCRGNPKLR